MIIQLFFIDTCANDTTFGTLDTIVAGQPLGVKTLDVSIDCVPSSPNNCDASFYVETNGPIVSLIGCQDIVYASITNYNVSTTSYQWLLDGQLASTDTSHACIGSSPMFVSQQTFGDSLAQGTYELCLIATSAQCIDTVCQNFAVGTTTNPSQTCISSPTAMKSGLAVDLDVVSAVSVNPADITWRFGDGNTATGSSPTHTYAQSGVYQVQVYVDDTACTDTLQYAVSVFGPQQQGSCAAYFNAMAFNATDVFFLGAPLNSGGGNTADVFMDFGDGTADTTNAGIWMHTYATAGTYNVCMSVTDTGGCTNTHCDSVTTGAFNTSSQVVSGQITALNGGQPAPVQHAEVYLIQHDPALQTLTALDTLTLAPADSGNYSFSGLAPDLYFVKAAPLPADPSYATTLPTYYGQSSQWALAAGVTVGYSGFPFYSQNATMTDITLLSGTNPGGPGFVGGALSSGANKTTEFEIADVSVQLFDVTNQSLVAHTMSNAQGEFSIGNLPYGTYRLHAEVLGHQTIDQIVTIGPNNPSVDDVEMDLEEGATTGRNDVQPQLTQVVVYPNPTSGALSVQLHAKSTSNATLTLHDLSGRVVYTQPLSVKQGHNTLDLQLGDLANGLYHLSLRSADGVQLQRKVLLQR